MRHLFGLALAALATLFQQTAPALEAPEVALSERGEVRLVSDTAVAAPGGTVRLALHQRLEGNWHTYWKNPGDSGLPTVIDWTLPEGVTAGPIEWPAPERIPFPPLINYGFSEEAILISEIRLPADWPAGQPLEIRADAEWLICDDICVPDGHGYTLSIPTGAEALPARDTAALFARGKSSQPVAAPGMTLRYDSTGEGLRIAIEAAELSGGDLEDVYFFPALQGFVKHTAPQTDTRVEDGRVLTVAKGDAWEFGEPPSGEIAGVLRARDVSTGRPVEIALSVSAAPGAVAPPAEAGGLMAILAAAAFAALGGMLLNLMPCVFPVLALKALSFAEQSGKGAAVRRAHGLAYGAGVLAAFMALAVALLALKGAGAAVGWGFQLQSPLVVGALAYLLFAVGLNLSGVYEVPSRLMGLGSGLAERGGRAGSFFTGLLAVVVATPCTAPFMGAAIGFALTQSWIATLVVFAALAIGFAAPMVALSLSPRLARMLPRPGAWMQRLREALAFPMYLAAAWLVWVLGSLAGPDAVFAALVGMVLIALAAWALGRGAPVSRGGRRAAAIASVLALLGAGAALTPAVDARQESGAVASMLSDGAEPWDPDRLASLRAEGRPVFVNFTADWCISCKVNERIALRSERFLDALAETGTVYMIGDWTRRDGKILSVLERHGRAGVPLYLVYPPGGGAPEVLPQILTPGLVAAAIETAGAERIGALD